MDWTALHCAAQNKVAYEPLSLQICHELQKIIALDEKVPNLVRYKEVVIGGYDPADDAEWEHDD